jgi:hypothetical protein
VQDPLVKAKAKADEYLRYAAEHEKRAEIVANPILRDALLNVAERYHNLAEQVATSKEASKFRRWMA